MLLAHVTGFLSFFSTLHNLTSIPPRRKTSTVATTSVSSEPLATNTRAFFPPLLHNRKKEKCTFNLYPVVFFNTEDYSFLFLHHKRYIDTHKQKKRKKENTNYPREKHVVNVFEIMHIYV